MKNTKSDKISTFGTKTHTMGDLWTHKANFSVIEFRAAQLMIFIHILVAAAGRAGPIFEEKHPGRAGPTFWNSTYNFLVNIFASHIPFTSF